jgi:excisionase family DNA binding protein
MSRTATVTRSTRPAPKRRAKSSEVTEPRWANNLKAARIRAHKSQEEVATHIGRKQRLISAIERGDRSGREYMDEIAEYLRVSNPALIFPYYDYYTYEEAAELMGVSSTLIARRVTKGELPHESIGTVRFIPKDALRNVELRKRIGKTKRERLRELLEASPDGLTSDSITDSFGPFKSDDERRKLRQVVQTILSRSPEFIKGVAQGKDAPLWTVSDA